MTAWRPTSGQRQVPRNENRFHRLNTTLPRHGGDSRGPTCSHYNRQSSGKKKHLTCQHHIGTMSPDHESDKIARVRVVGLKLESPPACHTYCPSSYPTIWNALLCYGFMNRPRNKMVSVGSCRIKKTEGSISPENYFLRAIAGSSHCNTRGSSRFGSFLVNINKRFVYHCAYVEIFGSDSYPKNRLLSRKLSSFPCLSR